MSLSEAFTAPCSVSLLTITPVLECPANSSSFETSAKRKNCSSLAAEAKDCKSFQYHCVLKEDLTSAIELCAPSINIIDNVCTTFSTYYKSIIRAQELNCSECPWSYNSTNAYQYKQCYSYANQHITTEITVSTLQTSRSANQTMMESRDQKENVPVAVTAVVPVVIVVCVGVAIYIYCRSRHQLQNESANKGQNIQLSNLDQELATPDREYRSAIRQEPVSKFSDEDDILQKEGFQIYILSIHHGKDPSSIYLPTCTRDVFCIIPVTLNCLFSWLKNQKVVRKSMFVTFQSV